MTTTGETKRAAMFDRKVAIITDRSTEIKKATAAKYVEYGADIAIDPSERI